MHHLAGDRASFALPTRDTLHHARQAHGSIGAGIEPELFH